MERLVLSIKVWWRFLFADATDRRIVLLALGLAKTER